MTVVVNNAGITIPKPLVERAISDWSGVIDTNLNGVGLRHPRVRPAHDRSGVGGSVINIASILAQREQNC